MTSNPIFEGDVNNIVYYSYTKTVRGFSGFNFNETWSGVYNNVIR